MVKRKGEMMIAIKDMEMPKNCASCVMRVGKCKERIYMENRPDRCPLIEIKTDGDTISRQQTIYALMQEFRRIPTNSIRAKLVVENLPSAQPEIANNLYLYKCYITDEDGLQHEVIHTGDIRRVTGWEI